jgi:hypothetical protein
MKASPMGQSRSAAVVVAIFVGAALAVIAVRASAAPAQFSLTFEGAHFADPAMPGGIRHDGRFTASAPFCSAGRAYDVRDVSTSEFLDVMRVHTCDDGSGSFTALMPTVRGEHGGRGTWQIVEGSGQYANLRGRGTYRGTLVSGDPEIFETIVYRTTWNGVVDFDADPPAIQVAASTRKLQRPASTYAVRIAVTARDPSTPISYSTTVTAGRIPITPLSDKTASTASGATITLRISPPRTTRAIRVEVTATDALGNTTSASRSVRLR